MELGDKLYWIIIVAGVSVGGLFLYWGLPVILPALSKLAGGS